MRGRSAAEVTAHWERLKIKVVAWDERNAGKPIDVAFHGTLRSAQEDGSRVVMVHRQQFLDQ